MTMRKILFLVPPSIDYSKFKSPPENVRTLPKKDGRYGSVLTDIPLGVLALSAYVKGYSDAQTKLIDFNTVLNMRDSFDYASFSDFFQAYLSQPEWTSYAPHIIGISALFATSYQNMLDIAACCRRIFPEATIIAGGGVPTNMYRQIFEDTNCFDGLIYGEGEKALLGLVTAEDQEKFMALSPSIVTKEKLARNQEVRWDFIENLDEIPLYDYDLLALDDYRLNPTISAYPGVDSSKPHITLMTSRGCPYHCIFCSAHSIHGRKVRFYSLERVKKDIAEIRKRYGTETIVFQDDHFMAKKDRAHEILRILKGLRITAFFPNSLTLYALDRPMLEALKDVGVNLLVLAIESGSERVLKEVMHKPLNQRIIRRVMKDCRELGIDTDVNIIIGLPGETKQDIEDARAFLKTLHGTWFRIYVAVPLMGSEMFDICIKKGYLKEGFIDGDFKKAVIETEEFTSEYIQKTAYSLNLDLNFVENGEVRLGNYARAVKEFENTIKVKNDHAFAYYFASKCYQELNMKEKYVQYRDRYHEILAASEFWQGYARQFSLAPLN
jgi:anaerobic magnesium-protoporphyrin IX monomethyl ester cyclase